MGVDDDGGEVAKGGHANVRPSSTHSPMGWLDVLAATKVAAETRNSKENFMLSLDVSTVVRNGSL